MIICSVLHRYSTLRQFHQSIVSYLPRDFPSFPPKKLGKRGNYDDEYLKIRCIQLNRYFNSMLSLQIIRKTASFQALFLPQEPVEPLPIEESSEEDSPVETHQLNENSIEEEEGIEAYQTVKGLIYSFFLEVFQVDDQKRLSSKLFAFLDE